jgi:hypothetical protein
MKLLATEIYQMTILQGIERLKMAKLFIFQPEELAELLG